MPTTSPSGVDQRPAGVAGVRGGIELDQARHQLVPLGRAKRAVQPGDDAGRHRRPDAEREADRHHVVARPQIARGAKRGRLQVVRQLEGADHREVVLRVQANQHRIRLGAIEEGNLDPPGTVHHVQVGQDRAVVDDHDARAHALLHLLLRSRGGAVAEALDAHHRRHHHLGRRGRARRQRLGLQRVQHRVVDVVLHQLARRRAQQVAPDDQAQRQQQAGDEQQRAVMAADEASDPGALGRSRCGDHGRGSRRHARRRLGGRAALLTCTAVERGAFHGVIRRSDRAAEPTPAAARGRPAWRDPGDTGYRAAMLE